MELIELLAPAKDLQCGMTAIDCGADAVYIGAPQFGARENAGNSLNDIAELTAYAHTYWAKVYVTLNTLLHDREIPAALRSIEDLHGMNIDGLIVQDMGLLECGLPPIPLIASTQTDNRTPEKIAFLEQTGFQRAILARELSLEQIKAIRKAAPHIELEFFIHGALCVCYSGQCYLSYALGGRSANRGQCAQPCRNTYSLADANGTILKDKKHLLSIRDLNLSDRLEDLIQAGINSFKIEGRLKDQAYAANTVSHYRRRIDEILSTMKQRRSSSGTSKTDFTPDLNKTFNRDYSTYFLGGKKARIGSIDTPKMMGAFLGKVKEINKNSIVIDTKEQLHPGDGICFFSANQQLCGTYVNRVDGNRITVDKANEIVQGISLFRNRDHQFLTHITKSRIERKIGIQLTLKQTENGLTLTAIDEDGVRAEYHHNGPSEPAKNPEKALETIRKQLAKTGDTEFTCESVTIELSQVCFLPLSTLNEFRRQVIEKLREARAASRPFLESAVTPNTVPYPEKELTFEGNVLNQHAKKFYERHGVTQIEPAAESGLDLQGRKVMTTKYCIKYQLGLCPAGNKQPAYSEPLYLIDHEGNRFELSFDCEQCEMGIYLPEQGHGGNEG